MWRNSYYYRSIRDGRTVRTEYVGTGPAAAVAELQDRRRRADRTAAVRARQSRERSARRELARAKERSAAVDSALMAGLEALGYHRTYRQWRRRHDALDPTTPPPPAIKAGLDLEEFAQSICLEAATKSPELRAQLARELVVKRAELAGSGPVPAAVMLAIGAALVAWLEFWMTQTMAAALRAQSDDGCPPSLDRRLSWAQRRYLSALAAVERIRRLAGRGRSAAVGTIAKQIDGPTSGPSPETPPVAHQGEHGPPGDRAVPGRARQILEPEVSNP